MQKSASRQRERTTQTLGYLPYLPHPESNKQLCFGYCDRRRCSQEQTVCMWATLYKRSRLVNRCTQAMNTIRGRSACGHAPRALSSCAFRVSPPTSSVEPEPQIPDASLFTNIIENTYISTQYKKYDQITTSFFSRGCIQM